MSCSGFEENLSTIINLFQLLFVYSNTIITSQSVTNTTNYTDLFYSFYSQPEIYKNGNGMWDSFHLSNSLFVLDTCKTTNIISFCVSLTSDISIMSQCVMLQLNASIYQIKYLFIFINLFLRQEWESKYLNVRTFKVWMMFRVGNLFPSEMCFHFLKKHFHHFQFNFWVSLLVCEKYLSCFWREHEEALNEIFNWFLKKNVLSLLSWANVVLSSPCKRRSLTREESLVNCDPCGLWTWALLWSEHNKQHC